MDRDMTGKEQEKNNGRTLVEYALEAARMAQDAS